MTPVLLAIAAALLFAVANNLQRGAASDVPLADGGPIRLLLRLARSPRWLAGAGLAAAALVLHARALDRGTVIVVQSILAAGLVFALAFEAVRERRWMRRGELLGSALLVAGVVLVLGLGRPGGGWDVGLREQAITAAALVGVGAVGLVGMRLHHLVRTSALVMGVVAGACFALDAVFLKGVSNHLGDASLPRTLDVVVNVGGFAAASAVGNVVVQRAYQVAPLRFVLPAVTVGDPLTAFLVGRLVLGETLTGGPTGHLAVGAGLAVMAVGIVVTTAGGAPANSGERSITEGDRPPSVTGHYSDTPDVS